MKWLDVAGVERRPLVFVEDHLYHTSDVLAAVHAARPDLIGCTTVVALDAAGPDTNATVAQWLAHYPALQVAAPVAPQDRVLAIAPADLADAAAYARLISRLLRPGGVLIQDVQLATLSFLPADRWWESIYLAATVRGMFPDRAPTVRFLSNKRGYSATFGRDLMDAGFDPRDVMDKAAVEDTVVPAIAELFDRAFPLQLETTLAAHSPGRATTEGPHDPRGRSLVPVADAEAERREIEASLDLVLWTSSHGTELGGRSIAGGRVALRAGASEVETWTTLIGDRLAEGAGIPVVSVGTRIGPPAAERAEITNLAARHMHTLRGRLVDGGAIVTANHAYRLAETLRVGVVQPRLAFGSARPSLKVTG